ncbi:AraC family transcriptional regulator [Rhodocytophaga aerolata]|uniref:AraC family transcriptional regulator n=1 Tax=Rhodocytophaga aerolata TaxID=455078 RepID=A0ABT8R5B5_9BACT|nr:AraC family transcriptional regulator [Rhodocytophaga aerolata]MDO1446876.1 AraC family transcriptional regulator [Rhodocytophaga aerolata]
MKRFNQYEPFNISHFELNEWPYPLHNHNHFEVIFIHQGSGWHNINEHQFSYQAGDVFLLGPQDSHTFTIAAATQFTYIRFTEFFFQNTSSGHTGKNLKQTIEYLFHTPYQSLGSLIKESTEKKKVENLITVLLEEYAERKKAFAESVIENIIRSILGILARNISAQAFFNQLESLKRSQALEDILVYVRQHIYYPDKLRMENLAEHMGYSPNYLSIFFKRQTGESLQQYILRYKLKLVETRLRYSEWSISQIAYELGFTDESHLSKLFKKYYQLSPGEFRKSVEQKIT